MVETWIKMVENVHICLGYRDNSRQFGNLVFVGGKQLTLQANKQKS